MTSKSLDRVNIGICFSLAFTASMRLNRRNTEDSTHPTWMLILTKLCSKRPDVLIPTAQNRIFFSVQDINNFFQNKQDPNETIAGGQIEVIPDFCVLFHRAALASGVQGTLHDVLEDVGPKNLPYHSISITTSFIPVLVELKRPVSRHCSDIEEFMEGLLILLNNARSQVESQAHCLFSVPAFYSQETTLVIAAVNQWWCYRLMRRSSFGNTFNGTNYTNEKAVQSIIEDELEENEVTLPRLMLPKDVHGMKKMVDPPQESLDQKRERQRKERDRRSKRRQQSKDRMANGYSDWLDFLDEMESDSVDFTKYNEQLVNAMNEYSKLAAAWRIPWERFTEGEKFIESRRCDISVFTDQWSRVMHLGSEESDHHLDNIQNYLHSWVKLGAK